MRTVVKILKWTGISLLTLLLVLSAVIVMRQNLTYDAPYPAITASRDSATIERGRQIVMGPAHCASCHGPSNAEELLAKGEPVPLSGGYKFDLPFGAIYARNITPDSETGIGSRTDGEIARTLRYGVHADGAAVLDFMPFHEMSDEDLTAVISYLRAQKPVANKVPRNTFTPLGMAVKAFMVKPVGPKGEVPKAVRRDSSLEYGRYLALNVANCNGCHTQRGMAGEYTGEPFAGGSPFDSIPGLPVLTPPNISGDTKSRIARWTEEDFLKRFRMGKAYPHTHMPWSSYKNMSDNDLKAIYRFLKSVRAPGAEPATYAVQKD